MYAEEKLIQLVNAELLLHLMDVRKIKERKKQKKEPTAKEAPSNE